ncbi:Uma2 family endonuclease [Streptomyces sp. NRRL S-87]|uniref:Uma2 family endonuclease n=1 Tax=Streptomyces sp. NRRL S-87 TaxID=1463920 RepID=UPI0004BEB007|nr:Uma2 family endonuclease [Streptomyces sp. NRRL S-87]
MGPSPTHVAPEPPEPEPWFRWPVPPPGGWAADDLDRLRGLPPHTELIDGQLVFARTRTLFHVRAVDFLRGGLQSAVLTGLEVVREFTVDIDRQNRPEPDVVVATGDVLADPDLTRLPASAVRLAVEVVSPESVGPDRDTKPLKYARARIPHFWRVENAEGRAVVYVYELDPATRAYVATGIFHDRLKVPVPFPIDLDLGAITLRRSSAG